MIKRIESKKSNIRRFKFEKSKRLTKQREFDRVFEAGSRIKSADITFIFLENDLPHPRLGISISRKVGRAVKRNRIKRKIREAFRLTQHDIGSYDIVCIPHSSADKLKVSEIMELFKTLFKKDENYC